MSTTTTDARLTGARRGVDRLRVIVDAGAAEIVPAIRRHLDALEREEASVRAAVLDAPDEVEPRIGLLSTRLDIAWASLTADVSDDWATFASAVEEELAGWEMYLERLQVNIASGPWDARTEAEAALADVRTRLIEVDARLEQARHAGPDGSQGERTRVTADRHALERQANELFAKVNRKEQET